ncbi:pyrethroid hydrolase Ces2a [Culicoides brevitarsis]|uniref:pyrethroid hydrolase Ces2a n=1 Tax=Culicoides brevitarsis TaxID=469753 RepID=UPI00307C5D75
MIQIFAIIFCTLEFIRLCTGQDANIVLDQGTIVGLKIFPETSRTAVYTYLGIPYAKPPVGNLRFTPPQPHPGWNRTLMTRSFKPLCPQLDNNIYEEVENGFNNFNNKITNEDCLFLNIWTPETAFRYGNFPVVVMITGEDMSFDWLINRPAGLDLASEGVIVVTVQYRTNVFGWLTLENEDAPGNLGLLDQNLALNWVKSNIHKFGGDASKVTLLGHGSGATYATLHLMSSRARTLFDQVILMSGSVFNKFYDFTRENGPSPSEKAIQILACDAPEKSYILKCLQEKSVSDITRAFDNIYKNGNFTSLFGPIIDQDFMPRSKVYIRDDPRKLLQTGNFDEIPIMLGLNSNEGAFIHEQWVDFAKQGFRSLKRHIDRVILPHTQYHYGLTGMGQKQITEAINWKYFDQIPKAPAHLLNALQKLVSETKYEVPFYETIEILSKTKLLTLTNEVKPENSTIFPITSPELAGPTREKTNFFVYLFQQSNTMDMRGKVNHFGGASHSSDLPYLLGPSLYQQIGRKKMTSIEEKLCRKMKSLFADFIKTGNPTPGRLYDAWHPFTFSHKYIKILSSKPESLFNKFGAPTSGQQDSEEMNFHEIEALLHPSTDDVQIVTSDVTASRNPYVLGTEREVDQTARQSKSSPNFVETMRDSEYYYYLKKVYAFWSNFLPKLALMLEQDRDYRRDIDAEQERLLENTSPKYKHAFFSMLTLVCLLLAILCVCVYILKKNDAGFNNSIL